ncbi:hypothetical protein HYC85_017115 [Camellia sinensis]|uniref:RNA-polymerase II-associated protein 3-like C-terminal domain-containing protein n=1 Tax=Camellia sinensis TaxID=4442 RepID=A0A7J7H2T9_CAMSI|nr:hypothetical protein HYC85_017115 [Camellia sinensis]
MARAPSKHGRDQSLVSSSQKIGVVGEDRRPRTKAPASDNPSTARQYDHLRNYDSIRNLSSGFMTEESSPDAASEKELGNEFFKQTKFQEAEDDCTEALNLDDRYIKAYSRRSTARKELGKLKESMEDAEFAMRLEPLNQEIKKQYAEAKSLYEKEILKKASGSLKNSMQGVQKEGKSKVEGNGHDGGIQSVSSSSHKMGAAAIQDRNKDSDGEVPARTPTSVVEAESKSTRGKGQEADASSDDAIQSSGLESSKRNHKKQELKASVQELAAQAASLAKIEAAKNITPPNSAYQFEVSWRGLAGDHTLQARLLKVTSPVALPQIFKNALSAPILIEIIRCIVTFFCEEMDLAVKYLENLAKEDKFMVDGSWRAADQSAAEAKACLDALQWAREKGMLCIIICTDSQQLLAALKENSNVDWLLSTIIKDICYYGRYFNVIIVSKVDRSVVKPTHNLAYCVNDFPT